MIPRMILAAALLAAAAAPAFAATPIDETRPLAADGRVSIENLKGRIVVRAWDRPEVHIGGTLALGGHAGVALVHLEDRFVKTAAQAGGEFLRRCRHRVRRAVRVARHADDEGVGLPLGEQGLDLRIDRLALGVQGGQWAGRAVQAHAHGHAHAPQPVVEGQRLLHLLRRQACPASWLSMRGSMPSRASALS